MIFYSPEPQVLNPKLWFHLKDAFSTKVFSLNPVISSFPNLLLTFHQLFYLPHPCLNFLNFQRHIFVSVQVRVFRPFTFTFSFAKLMAGIPIF